MAPVPDPFRLELHDRLDSTNDLALVRARSGDPGSLWVVAREQSAGRGRQGRAWSSPRGNLYASLLLVDSASQEAAPQLGLVAGVAIAAAISDLLRGDRRLGLKWPNDLVFARAKLAGVLLEAARLADDRFACVIGFGVNCASHPAGLPYPATDLATIGRAADPLEVLERLSAKVAEWLAIWDRGRGFSRVRDNWLLFATGLGERIRVRTRQKTLEGAFQGLSEEGRLLLQIDDGPLAIEAGDVFLPFEGAGDPHGNSI